MKEVFTITRSKRGYRPAQRRHRNGFALVMTLTMLAILTTMVVAFLSVSRSDRSVAYALRGAQTTRLVAQGAIAHAVDLLRSNIPTPTHLGVKTRDLTPNTFTVNPGLLRVINGTGVTAVDLHTGAVPATPPPDLSYPEDLDIVSYDLNAPVPGEVTPAIVWPVDANGDPVAANTDGSPTAPSPVMRVGWHNVVADPTLPAGATNPIVSRYAFWIDDECGRLNYNVMGGKPSIDNNVTTPVELYTSGSKYWREVFIGHPTPAFRIGRVPKSAKSRGGGAIDDDTDFNPVFISLGHIRSTNFEPILKEWAYAGNQNALNLLRATALQHYQNHGSQLYPEGILNYMTEARYAAAGGVYDRQVHPDDIEWYQKNKWNITAASKAPEFDAFGRPKHYMQYSPEGREGGGSYQGPFVYNDKSPTPTNATDRVPYVNLSWAASNVKWTRINLETVDRIYRYLRKNWPKGGGGSYAFGGNPTSHYQTALNAWWLVAQSQHFQNPSQNSFRSMQLTRHLGTAGVPGWAYDNPVDDLWFYDSASDQGTYWKPLNTDRINNYIRYKGTAMLPQNRGPYITEVQFEVEPEMASATHFRLRFRWKAEYYMPPFDQTWKEGQFLPVQVDVFNIFGRRGGNSPWGTPWGHRSGNVADLSGVLENWEPSSDPTHPKRTLGIPVHTRISGRTDWVSQWNLGNWAGWPNNMLRIVPTKPDPSYPAVVANGPSDVRTWINQAMEQPTQTKDWNFQVATSQWFYIQKIADDWGWTADIGGNGGAHYRHRDGIKNVTTNPAVAQEFPLQFYGPHDHDTDALTPDVTEIFDAGNPLHANPGLITTNQLQLAFQMRFGLWAMSWPVSLTPLQSRRNWSHYPTWARPSVAADYPVAGANLPADQDLLTANVDISPLGGTVIFGWENTTDPRLYGKSQNWRVTNAGHIDPRYRGTMGAPNMDDWREYGWAGFPNYGLWNGMDTSKFRPTAPRRGDQVGWGWRIPWPGGVYHGYPFVDRDRNAFNSHQMDCRMPSAGFLSLVHSGITSNQPWQTLNYGGRGALSTLGGLPDWVLSEIYTPSYLYQLDQYSDDGSGPDDINTISYMHSTAGKVNINTEIFPKSAWFNPPERRRPLEGVFYNLRPEVADPTVPPIPDEASAFVTNVLDAQSATNYFLYPGELTGVAGYAKGNTEWTKEAILRNMYSCLTTNSNTFGVWGVAQTVQKTEANLDGTNDGTFEKGDRVTGERRFYALVERSIYPGKDGVPGNAHVDPVTGVFDRLSVSTQPYGADYDIDGDGDKEPSTVMDGLPGSAPRFVTWMGNGPGENFECWWPQIDGPSAAAGVVGMALEDVQWGYIGNQTDTYHGRYGGLPVTAGAAATFEDAYNPVEPVYKYEVKYFRYIDE